MIMYKKSKLESLPNKVLFALCKKILDKVLNRYRANPNPFKTMEVMRMYESVLKLADATKPIDIDYVFNIIKLNGEDFFNKREEFELKLPKLSVYEQYFSTTYHIIERITQVHKIESYSSDDFSDVTAKFDYEDTEDLIDKWNDGEEIDRRILDRDLSDIDYIKVEKLDN
jgi:hypothetical protein